MKYAVRYHGFCADLCRGQGVLLANPTRTQLLESELASLAPRLSSLTVLMRTAVLPVMSLTNPEAAKRLQVVCPPFNAILLLAISLQYYQLMCIFS